MKQVYQLLDNQFSASEFESWVYDSEHLERLLGADEYTALICFDYTQPHAAHELKTLLVSIVEGRAFAEWVLRDRLNAIVSGTPAGLDALCWCYEAHHNGYLFLDSLAFRWGIEAVDRLALGHTWPGAVPLHALVDTLVVPARNEAEQVLAWLDRGVICILAKPWTYDDSRSTLDDPTKHR